MNKEVIVLLSNGIGDPQVRDWFGIAENLAVNILLRTLLIDQCIRGVFPTKRKIFSWHSWLVANITTKKATNMINIDVTVFNGNTKWHKDALTDEFDERCAAHHLTIPAYKPVRVLIVCHRAGIMTIETRCNALNADVPRLHKVQRVLYLESCFRCTSQIWRLSQLICLRSW